MAPGLQIVTLQAELDPEALAEGRAALKVERVRLRFSVEGLALVLPPGAPVSVERLRGGHAFLRVRRGSLAAVVEVWPTVSPSGRLRLEPVSVRAGLLPLPRAAVAVVLGRLREELMQKPGLHVAEGNVAEIDLGEILWYLAGKIGASVELPRLQTARAGEGILELEYHL
jgi:hypothetical protein